jgi:hypothetical protein
MQQFSATKTAQSAFVSLSLSLSLSLSCVHPAYTKLNLIPNSNAQLALGAAKDDGRLVRAQLERTLVDLARAQDDAADARASAQKVHKE